VADIIFIVITAAFFALSIAYVKLCDRIIGPDPTPGSGGERALEPEVVKR
jgi:hypothetical protein